MHKLASAALFGLLAMAPALAEPVTGPSFDCEKASTAAEKAICEAPGLGWYDRQLAKAWTTTEEQLGDTDLAPLKTSQDAFLKAREACAGTADSYSCLVTLYTERLRTLTKAVGNDLFEAGTFVGEAGGVDLVRYPDGTAALSIATSGGGDHTGGFETDTALSDDAGTITWSEKPDPSYADACTITGTREGKTLTINAEGDACTWYCGARAELGGTFALKE